MGSVLLSAESGKQSLWQGHLIDLIRALRGFEGTLSGRPHHLHRLVLIAVRDTRHKRHRQTSKH